MTLLQLQNIKKSFRGVPVLDGAALSLNRGEKIGLVGPNGCGKTTLLGIAAGIVSLDEGKRSIANNLTWGVLRQTPDFGDAQSVLQAALRAQIEIDALDKELKRLSSAMDKALGKPKELDRLIHLHGKMEERYRFLGGYSSRGRAEAVLRGIGFNEEDFSKPPNRLSGGEVKRLQLASILLGNYDILFLDEPGNHLDISGTEWLTGYLGDYGGSLIVVSHDRYLLNHVVHRIIELEGGCTYSYKGNCDFFLKERQKRIESALKKQEAQEKTIAKGEEFIRRNFYGQKARQAKSKRKMLDRMESVKVHKVIGPLRFRFKEDHGEYDHVLRLDKLSARFGDKILFRDLKMDLNHGETLGIIGPNGSGKSTLLKIILGLEASSDGTVWVSPLAKITYMDQRLEDLGISGNLLDHMRERFPLLNDGELRNHLARFLFRGDEVKKDLSDLSGGEKSRALLAQIALEESNFLILDEPTNHLDIYTRESLEQALNSFSGTTLIVSHDRLLLDGIVDHLLVLGGHKPFLHKGNYTSFTDSQKADPKRTFQEKLKAKSEKTERKKAKKTDSRIKRKHTYDELEALIITKEERLKEIDREIYKEEVYRNNTLYRQLEEEAAMLRKELKLLYMEWDTWA